MRSLDIANIFIGRHGEDIALTNLTLNKLVYYAQVEAIRENGLPLFDDRIEAWQYGPVEPAVYHEFKKYGRSRISSVSGRVKADARSIAIVDRVAATYGKMSAFELVSFSHREGGAWRAVYDSSSDREITIDDIRASDDMKGFAAAGRSVESVIESFVGSIPNAMRMLENG